MVTKYISQESAINELRELLSICRESLPNENGKHYVIEEELYIFYNRLSNIPAADVKPVVRGEWMNDTRYSGWTCSNCDYHDGNATDNYCPNCGADMRGEECYIK